VESSFYEEVLAAETKKKLQIDSAPKASIEVEAEISSPPSYLTSTTAVAEAPVAYLVGPPITSLKHSEVFLYPVDDQKPSAPPLSAPYQELPPASTGFVYAPPATELHPILTTKIESKEKESKSDLIPQEVIPPAEIIPDTSLMPSKSIPGKEKTIFRPLSCPNEAIVNITKHGFPYVTCRECSSPKVLLLKPNWITNGYCNFEGQTQPVICLDCGLIDFFAVEDFRKKVVGKKLDDECLRCKHRTVLEAANLKRYIPWTDSWKTALLGDPHVELLSKVCTTCAFVQEVVEKDKLSKFVAWEPKDEILCGYCVSGSCIVSNCKLKVNKVTGGYPRDFDNLVGFSASYVSEPLLLTVCKHCGYVQRKLRLSAAERKALAHFEKKSKRLEEL